MNSSVAHKICAWYNFGMENIGAEEGKKSGLINENTASKLVASSLVSERAVRITESGSTFSLRSAVVRSFRTPHDSAESVGYIIDMADKNTTATQDDLAKVERAVYNASGTSQNMFNTEGNMALEKSVLNDEGMVRPLLLQFEVFFDRIVQSKGNSKYNFRKGNIKWLHRRKEQEKQNKMQEEQTGKVLYLLQQLVQIVKKSF